MRQARKLIALGVLFLGLAIPATIASANIGGPYTSGISIQNLSNVTATVALQFVDQTGATAGTYNTQIAPLASFSYFPLGAVSVGFNGSLVVSSDQQVAATANVVFPDFSGQTTYNGFSAGATAVNLPLVMRGNFGLDTWFNVQNTGATAATAYVTYQGGCTDSKSIQPGASQTFDQSATGCLSDGFFGAATVTSTQPIVATVLEIKRPLITGQPKSLWSYDGWTDSNTTLFMPTVQSNFYNSGTGIAIYNIGGSPTNVTLTYTPSGGGLPGHSCTETHAVPAASFTSFGFPQLPAACGQTGVTGVTDPVNGGFVGSAAVTTNSAGQQLVGIVNQINRVNANADAYNAVNPSHATSKVSMPLIMDRNFGLFTGINIMNVGTLATSISCTFANTAYVIPSTLIQPGASLSDVELNKISSGYVGSGTCTATGGDAKIAGIVNELKSGIPSTNDGFSDYAAANY